MRWLILALAAIPAFALWAWIVFLGTSNGWWREALAPEGDAGAFARAASHLIDEQLRGNAAFRLIRNGDVVGEHYASVGARVDAGTRFPVASLSKWFTAWGVMTLVEAGKLELDTPVSRYLSRWHLPESPFDNEGVTVRRLLSHTAGLTDALGYQGFAPGSGVQRLEDSLTRAQDAMTGADGRLRVGVEPGTEWRYSGGGFALLQLLIEEVTQEDFEIYMRRAVLDPLGLASSTFAIADDAPDVATSYDGSGRPAPHYRYSAAAAAGLYSSTADMTRFLEKQLPGPAGEPPGRGVLEPETLALMRQPHASALGRDVWGLGHMLYAENAHGGHVIGHDGMNRPAATSAVRLDPDTGDGIVVLITGNPSLAGRLAGEWTFWHTGTLDIVTFYAATGDMMVIIAIGWMVIILAVVLLGWLATRNRPRAGEPEPG